MYFGPATCASCGAPHTNEIRLGGGAGRWGGPIRHQTFSSRWLVARWLVAGGRGAQAQFHGLTKSQYQTFGTSLILPLLLGNHGIVPCDLTRDLTRPGSRRSTYDGRDLTTACAIIAAFLSSCAYNSLLLGSQIARRPVMGQIRCHDCFPCGSRIPGV